MIAHSENTPRLTVYHRADPIGWIDVGGRQEHPEWQEAERSGLGVHAIPRGGTLAVKHYPTVDRAMAALLAHAQR